MQEHTSLWANKGYKTHSYPVCTAGRTAEARHKSAERGRREHPGRSINTHRACSGELPSTLSLTSTTSFSWNVTQRKSGEATLPHLGHGRVDLQDLFVTFDLSHADFAGELGGSGAVSLQLEGTVQGLLVAAPHLREGEFLGNKSGGGTLSSAAPKETTDLFHEKFPVGR